MRITLRGLQALTITLAVSLLGGTSYFIFQDWVQQYHAYNQGARQFRTLEQLTALSATLAEERGLRAVQQSRNLPVAMRMTLTELWRQTTQTTDQLLQSLQQVDPDHIPAPLRSDWAELLKSARVVPTLRAKRGAFEDYSRIIHQLIVFQQQLTPYIPSIHLQQDLQSLIDLEQVREQAAQERGVVMRILLDGQLDADRFFAIAGHINQQALFLEEFKLAAEKNIVDWLTHKLQSREFRPFYAVRNHLRNLFDLQERLNTLLSHAGYDGLIHYYKNYLLRGDPEDYAAAVASFQSTMMALESIRKIPNLSQQQAKALDLLEETFKTYFDNLSKITRLRALGLSAEEIDRRIRVNDRPAITAINSLRQVLANITPESWWSITTRYIGILSQTVDRQLDKTQAELKREQTQLRQQLISGATFYSILILMLMVSALYTSQRMTRLQSLIEKLGSMVHAREYTPLKADGQDEIARLVTTFNALLHERKLHEQDVWKQSHLDPLTQLPNRAYLLQLLDFVLKDAHRNQERVAVLFIDLDGFKAVNDTEGHRAGDELLEVIAQRLKQTLRQNDILARIGGDEFIIVLPHIKRDEQVDTVVKKIIDAAARPVRLNNGKVVNVSASVGVTLYPDDGTDVDTLLMHADMAMYHAKDAGKNQAARFNPDWSDQLRREQEMVELMTEAARTGDFAAMGFSVHYQPIINIQKNHTSHLEALLRWHHPKLGFVSPADFIPVAERSQLIIPLGEWVLETALKQANQWRDQFNQPLGVAINLSPVQARDHFQRLTQRLEALEAEGLDPSLLDLEITESLIMDDTPEVRAALESLRQKGCRLFLDDFGTGYSSLSYLKRYPFDVIKIDRAFINDLLDDPQDRELVNAIISLAQALEMRVVAEGVETSAQLDYLRQKGCHYVQGFYLARPMDGETCTQWLREHG